MKNIVTFFALTALTIAGVSTSVPARGQTVSQPAISAPYQSRADQIFAMLGGAQNESELFAQTFLDAVPLTQFRPVIANLRTQYGEPQSIDRIIPASDWDGTIEVGYEKATVAIRVLIDQADPHPVLGFLITGVKMRDDGLAKITEEFKSLPGSAGFEIARIAGNRTERIAGFNNNRHYAIGSSFKLYVLAELSRSIQAGERAWDDVIRLDHKSMPSGVLQNWPDDAPLTLQTLATLMISISDNTATDLLINDLGRDRVGVLVSKAGHSDPAKMLPILTTLELFALKMPGNNDLRKRYTGSNDDKQNQLLESEKSRLGLSSVRIENVANKPLHIDTVEWFASPGDINRLMAHIETNADDTAKQIMAIGGNVGPGDKARWSYVGSKGGSEPGVIFASYLLKSKSGQSYAVSGGWNNTQNPVDGKKFEALMNRLLNLLAEQEGVS